MNPEKPVFVVGTPRSGTTLTAKILGRHPELFMPGETHYFDDIYARRDEIGTLENDAAKHQVLDRLSTLYNRYYELPDQERIDELFRDKELLNSFMRECGDYECAFSWFMDIQMRKEGKVRWGNNAPRDLFSWREISGFYPDAKFVICVRDLRDFLLSYQGKWKVTGDDHVERLKKLYHPVVTSMLWKSSMRQLPALKDAVSDKDIVVVPYESLVRDPEGTVRTICDTIEVEYLPGMLEVDSNNSSSEANATGIFSSSVGRWETRLSKEEIYIAQLVAGKEMTELAYSMTRVSPNYLKVLMIFLAAPFALWRGLQANKDVRGPLIPYLLRRVSSLVGSR